ncbi:uncharacterized protein LOC111328037 isoform X1 [Stylophora pistillata]|uniref:Uncharacterized protein n=1 Tax=Stylophora pistillata TaxID=50429 RepID=A0A2B4SEU6_STYPI|nr:uncharacterized protein LOC111328037 isoform X1 [Stylophora pistillata]PFX27128.1 hypothetical protein AWC38_SpisGene8178 [Stylophora pistillata]
MEIIDGQPMSEVDGQSAEAHSSAISIETEFTHEKDFIVFTLSLGAKPEQVSAANDSENKVCSSSVNSGNSAAAEEGFDEMRWSCSDDLKSQQGFAENTSCLSEWENVDTMNKSSGNLLVKKEEEILPEVTASFREDFSLDLQAPSSSYSPEEYSNDLRLSLSSSPTNEVSNIDDVLACVASGKQPFPDIYQATDDIDMQVLRRVVSTLTETSIERHCSYLGADKETGDTSTTTSKLLALAGNEEDRKKNKKYSEEDISDRMSANEEDKTNEEPVSDSEHLDLSQNGDCSWLGETAGISKSLTIDKEGSESLCEDTLAVSVGTQKDVTLEKKKETPSGCRNLDQPNKIQIIEVKDNPYETPLHLCLHTFLCESSCRLRHHELIQLLCATPDHRSVKVPSVESKSLLNFRNYLNDNLWHIHRDIPEPSSKLRFPIVHLACLLGKYKALEELSKIGFDPVIQTSETRETPLHMVMRLIRHFEGTMHNLFLSNAVVNIFKTLSRTTPVKVLLSMKDCRGNTAFHSLAEMMGQGKLPLPAAMLLVYVFRVFVHFQLKELSSSEARSALWTSLKKRNDSGQSVESLLMRSLHGAPLLKFLQHLCDTRESSPTLLEGQGSAKVNGGHIQKEGCVEAESDKNSPGLLKENQGSLISPKSSTTTDPTKHSHAHLLSGTEHESIVDFILSSQWAISNSDKRTILAQFRAEYDARLKSMEKRVSDVKQQLPQTLRQLKLKRKNLEKEARRAKSRITWSTGAMRKAIDKRNKQRRECNKINATLSLVHELKKAIDG